MGTVHAADQVAGRRSPAFPLGPPQIQFKPGVAAEMFRELAPLRVEDGIDVDDIDVPDLATLQPRYIARSNART